MLLWILVDCPPAGTGCHYSSVNTLTAGLHWFVASQVPLNQTSCECWVILVSVNIKIRANCSAAHSNTFSFCSEKNVCYFLASRTFFSK